MVGSPGTERLAVQALDDRARRASLLAELRTAVPFDAYVWVATDPVTEVGASPLAEVPVLADLPALVRLKYVTALHRWTTLPAGRVALLADGDPRRSPLWCALLRGYGVRDVASAALRDAHGCWGFLDLWRRTPFTTREQALLADRLPVLTGTARAGVAATLVAPPAPAPPEGAAVLLLTDALEPCAGTPDSDARLRTLLPTPPDRSPVPAVALNVAAQLLAREAGIDAHVPATRLHQAGGRWIEVRAARLDPQPPGPATIAVTIEPLAPARRVEVFCRACGLTARETDVVGQLVDGADTRTAARALAITEHTVNDHLRSIFAKTGTGGRARLVRAARG